MTYIYTHMYIYMLHTGADVLCEPKLAALSLSRSLSLSLSLSLALALSLSLSLSPLHTPLLLQRRHG